MMTHICDMDARDPISVMSLHDGSLASAAGSVQTACCAHCSAAMAMTLRSIFVVAALAMEASAIHVEKALREIRRYNTDEPSTGGPVFADVIEDNGA